MREDVKPVERFRFVVDRRTWLRGEGVDQSYLLRIDGKKCCIGFACEAAGVPLSAMFNCSTPMNLLNHQSTRQMEEKLKAIHLLTTNSYSGQSRHAEGVAVAFRVNDGEGDVCREQRITELLFKEGIDVEFIN